MRIDAALNSGLLFSCAAQAGNWLITPMQHPDASNARWAAVVAQAVICLAVALWLVWRQRQRDARASTG